MNGKLAICVVATLIVIMGIGIYNMILLPTPSSDRDVIKELQITSDTGYIETSENVSFFTVKGVVRNNCTVNMRSINVTATFYDPENKTIKENVGHVAFKILRPNQTAPFEIYMSLNQSSEIPDHYQLTTIGIETYEEPYDTLKTVNSVQTVDDEGYYRIFGEVQNKGWMTARIVKVICAYYDSNDNLIAMSRVFTSPDSIRAGSKASFEFSLKPSEVIPERFDLFVVAHHYHLISIPNLALLVFLILVFVGFVAYMKRRGW